MNGGDEIIGAAGRLVREIERAAAGSGALTPAIVRRARLLAGAIEQRQGIEKVRAFLRDISESLMEGEQTGAGGVETMSKLYGTLFSGGGSAPTLASDRLLAATVQNRTDAVRVMLNDTGAVSVALGPSTVAADAATRATSTVMHADLATLAAVASDPRFAEDIASAYLAAVQRLGTDRPTATSVHAAMRADAATAGVALDDWASYVEDRGGRFGRYVSLDHDAVLVSEDRMSGAWIVSVGNASVHELPRSASAAEIAAAAIEALLNR